MHLVEEVSNMMVKGKPNIASARLFLKQLIQRILDNRLPDLSAQLAFYFLLSLFPFLIFAMALFGYFVSSEEVLALLSRYVPSASMDVIEGNVRDVLDVERGSLLSFGMVATIWSASHATNALIRALNEAYDVEESRPFWKARGTAIVLTFALIGILLVALILPVFGQAIGLLFFSLFHMTEAFWSVWNVLRWGISFTVLFSVLVFLYYAAPNKRLDLRDIAAGALFATVSWQLVSYAFSFIVNEFGHYSATYGGLAGAIVLMLWFYLTGLILLVGGEINATLHFLKRERKTEQ